MFHLDSKTCLVLVMLASLTGCNLDGIFGDDFLGQSGAALGDVPPRLALGAIATPSVHRADDTASITSANPSVVTVDRTHANQVLLTGVGVGQTTVSIHFDGRSQSYPVEVAPPERYELQLAERDFWNTGPIPTVPMQERAFLADVRQQFLVIYYDSDGPLFGRGLAELTWPPGVSECAHDIVGPVDAHCVELDPGPHAVRVDFDGNEQAFLIGGVAQADIIDFHVWRVAEVDAEAGDLIGVAAHGVTIRGTRVFGMHQRFVEGTSETFAYEYDPAAAPTQTKVHALDFTHDFEFRGSPVSIPPLWDTCQDDWFGGC